MQYDPIKRQLGKVFNSTPFLRKLFYRMLDLLLLRTWHVKRELKKNASSLQNINVLDAGSGFGQYVYYMSRKHPDWQIKGLDVKTEQIADCNHFFDRIGFNNVHFEEADLTKIKYQQQFELVVCVDVMEHIEEDELVLRNYFNALKPGGMLLISTPSDQGGSDVHQHDHQAEGIQGFIDEHVRDGYNIADLDAKLKRAGFAKTKLRYQYGMPGKISWRLSMKYPILMLNASKLFFIILPLYYLLVFPIALILNKMDVCRKHPTGTGLIALAWKQ
ncbi:MAG TPA: class I SAM-dependent methyltransferase [Bacteroidales bacterium]|nr:class I SAM-dependent methyltransferase [Bacteroidales bacterium]MDD4086706.1 class I SAM-dependent methyltransferase [Bacteroidales bacterium]HPE43986.1 class I SAM-dependent methyltransferase [Bacteroidales bacterium]